MVKQANKKGKTMNSQYSHWTFYKSYPAFIPHKEALAAELGQRAYTFQVYEVVMQGEPMAIGLPQIAVTDAGRLVEA